MARKRDSFRLKRAEFVSGDRCHVTEKLWFKQVEAGSDSDERELKIAVSEADAANSHLRAVLEYQLAPEIHPQPSQNS